MPLKELKERSFREPNVALRELEERSFREPIKTHNEKLLKRANTKTFIYLENKFRQT